MHPLFVRASSRPVTARVLVAFVDQARFAQNSRGRPSAAVFADLNEFYLQTEQAVTAAGGLVIKYLGDAALVVFPRELAGAGTMALLRLKADVEAWFRERAIDSALHVNVHFGEVTLGRMGSIERLDVVGETVNACAMLPHQGVCLSPEAYRRLSAADRRRFRRSSAPVTYGLAPQD